MNAIAYLTHCAPSFLPSRARRASSLVLLMMLAACGPRASETRPAEHQVDPEPDPAPAPATEPDPEQGSFPLSRGGAELVGTPARPFAQDLVWLDESVESLESLRGKVVLVRFWTDACPFCEASAPGLTRLHERYAGEGLVVVGIFHPKPRGETMETAGITGRAEQLGLRFPIAVDQNWSTLESWWLRNGQGARKATSTSFLIDAKGRVRWVHPGPEFHPDGPPDHEQCRQDFEDARRAIEILLAERGE